MVQSYEERYTGAEYLTGQEVSYEEIMAVLANRNSISSIGDNDIM